ncbi:MAG: Maf family protein [Deltaproteobacteria bacterium]|nr:Maf family protein [Deltaproteobacteria bacterium]
MDRPAVIILASESRYRRELIARLGFGVQCIAADYDEEREKDRLGNLSVISLVKTLAEGKATSLAQKYPDALILGSDQAVELEGMAMGKPHTAERAVAQLARLSGKTHQIHTAVCVHHGRSGRSEHWLDTHELTMRTLSRAQLEHYVRLDQPLDCAGSYKIEGPGIALFESIRGLDFTGVIGLPLTAVVTLLDRFGVKPFMGH